MSLKTPTVERVWHPWWKWECYPAGFFATSHPTLDKEACEIAYSNFLSDLRAFEGGILQVMNGWTHSCEHWLTNPSMNRIAWIGQSAACAWMRLPAKYRSGYKLMTETQQREADELAEHYLNLWCERYATKSDEGIH